MVNMDMVLSKLARGLTTGAGVFASTIVGDLLDEAVPGGDTGVALGQMAVGAGVAVGAERIAPGNLNESNFQIDANLLEAGVEHFGYGIHGAGFAELADQVQTGAQTGQSVTVRARSQDAMETQDETNNQADSFSIDTA